MRVATWCIGGVCGYLDVLCHWLKRRRPDLVALQKICVKEEGFPADALCRVGYRSYPLRRQTLYGGAVAGSGRSAGARDSGAGAVGRGRTGRWAADRPRRCPCGFVRVCTLRESGRAGKGRCAYVQGGLAGSSHRPPRGAKSRVGPFPALRRLQRTARCSREARSPELHTRGAAATAGRSSGPGSWTSTGCVNPLPDQGLNYGFNPRLPPTARLQLILAGERVAASASDVWVDEEYRAVIDELGNRTWPASAPVIADLGDPL